MTRWTSWENQKAPSLTQGDFKATAKQEQHLWVRRLYPLDLGVPYHTFRSANKASICVFFRLFLWFSLFSTCFPSLTLCLLFPHYLLAPKGKKGVSVSSRFVLAPSSWEGGRRYRRSHGSLQWSFNDRVGRNSLLWSWGSTVLTTHSCTDTLVKLGRWREETGMHICCLNRGFLRYMMKPKDTAHNISAPIPPIPNLLPRQTCSWRL